MLAQKPKMNGLMSFFTQCIRPSCELGPDPSTFYTTSELRTPQQHQLPPANMHERPSLFGLGGHFEMSDANGWDPRLSEDTDDGSNPCSRSPHGDHSPRFSPVAALPLAFCPGPCDSAACITQGTCTCMWARRTGEYGSSSGSSSPRRPSPPRCSSSGAAGVLCTYPYRGARGAHVASTCPPIPEEPTPSCDGCDGCDGCGGESDVGRGGYGTPNILHSQDFDDGTFPPKPSVSSPLAQADSPWPTPPFLLAPSSASDHHRMMRALSDPSDHPGSGGGCSPSLLTVPVPQAVTEAMLRAALRRHALDVCGPRTSCPCPYALDGHPCPHPPSLGESPSPSADSPCGSPRTHWQPHPPTKGLEGRPRTPLGTPPPPAPPPLPPPPPPAPAAPPAPQAAAQAADKPRHTKGRRGKGKGKGKGMGERGDGRVPPALTPHPHAPAVAPFHPGIAQTSPLPHPNTLAV